MLVKTSDYSIMETPVVVCPLWRGEAFWSLSRMAGPKDHTDYCLRAPYEDNNVIHIAPVWWMEQVKLPSAILR